MKFENNSFSIRYIVFFFTIACKLRIYIYESIFTKSVPCMWSDYILIYLHGWYVDIVYWARRVVTRPCLFIKRDIESQSRINFSLELCILSRQFCFGTEWYYNISICGKKTFVYSLCFVLLRRIIFYVNNIRSFCDILHTHPYIHIRFHLNVAQYLWSFKKNYTFVTTLVYEPSILFIYP